MGTIFLKNETSICKFDIKELLFIRCEDHCLSFHSNENVFHTTGCLSEISKNLPGCFVQINRNTVINLNLIKEIRLKQRKIILQNQSEHIISHRRMTSLYKILCFPGSKILIHTLDDNFDTFTKNN